MTDTNGLDILIAWTGFAVLVIVLAVLLLRPGVKDPVTESHRETEDARRDDARQRMNDLPAETAAGRIDPPANSHGPTEPRPPG